MVCLQWPFCFACLPHTLNTTPPTPHPSPSPSTPVQTHAGSCTALPLPNGAFESDRSLDATKLVGWAKLKENATVGGGGLFNASAPSYTGFPGHPFASSPGRYFRTHQAKSVSFALVNNVPINVTSEAQALYFDWFVDNAWPYWFVSQSMSLNANGSDVIMHQARVDLYDYDKLKPPGNLSHLSEMIFDRLDSEAGAAHAGAVLVPEALAAARNLASMATVAPLGRFVGRRLLVAFRYATNVYFLGWGLDNVMVVDCGPGGKGRGGGKGGFGGKARNGTGGVGGGGGLGALLGARGWGGGAAGGGAGGGVGGMFGRA